MYPFPRMFEVDESRESSLPGNLRRLMAREGVTAGSLAERSGLDERTIKGLLAGGSKPHARTLHKLACGLNVDVNELFHFGATLNRRGFDRGTNPAVNEAVEARPDLFHNWDEADVEELASRFAAGGELTVEGACQSAEAMNRRRDVQSKVALIMETHEGDLLADLVETLYRRVVISSSEDLAARRPTGR